ncbi:MAG: hypothetical protein U0175_20915 [Caldilineaceae bacterium]
MPPTATATKTNTPVPPTATNTPASGKASITIIKDAQPNSTQDFRFYSAFGTFLLDDEPNEDDGVSSSITFANVNPGSYNFSEAHQSGWKLSAIQCTPSNHVTVDLSINNVLIAPVAGDVITCTFINQAIGVATATPTNTSAAPTATATKTPVSGTSTPTATATKTPVAPTNTPVATPVSGKAKITFVKQSEPKSIQDFTYYGAFGTFLLDDPATDDGDGVFNSITYNNVTPGTYSFSEAHQASWELSAINCTPSARATVDLANLSVTLQPQAGDTIVCTFVNERLVNIDVHKFNDMNGDKVKQTSEPYLSGWNIGIYNTANQLLYSSVTDSTGVVSKANLPPDSYKVCETPQSGWTNSLPATLDATLHLPCYTITLNPGEGASVLFGNTRAALSSQGQSVNANQQGVKVSNLPDINEAPTLDPALSGRVIFLPVVSK